MNKPTEYWIGVVTFSILIVGICVVVLAMSNRYTNALMEMCPDHENKVLVECK